MSFNEDNFPDLPSTWLTVRTRDVHTSISNFEKLKTQDYLPSGYYPVVDQGSKLIGGYSNDSTKVILIDNPVIIFGDHTRNLKYINFPFIAGADGTKILRPVDIINPRTFFYFLRAVSLPDRGYGRHFQYLRESQIPLPPLAEQVRIADKLDALLARVDAGRERLERVPKLVKRFRQAVLSAAVSGELTREWRGGRDAEWEETEFKNVCKEITVGFVGKMSDEYTEEGIPFLRSQNVRPFRFDAKNLLYINEVFHTKIRKSALQPGDVVVVRSGAPGQCCVIPTYLPVANCSDLVIVKPSSKLLSDFACIFINSETSQVFVRAEQVGVAQAHFNVGSMKIAPLALPPLPEQAEIVRRVKALFAIADRLEARAQAALARYARLTPALLAKAFRGELVPQDPSDEPASVLLERIRAQRAAQGEKPRRGRTPKAASAGGTGEPKRRGRPPRAQVQEAAPEGGALPEGQEAAPVQRRGRGRPRKDAGQAGVPVERRIPVAASAEEAIRLMQERARVEREGKQTVQAGLFGED